MHKVNTCTLLNSACKANHQNVRLWGEKVKLVCDKSSDQEQEDKVILKQGTCGNI